MNKQAFPPEECSRFMTCSVNRCPLDPYMELRNRVEGESRCTYAKTRRHRIGKKYPDLLPYQGMTAKEWKAKQRWEAMPEEEKQRRLDILKRAREKKGTV